MPAIPVDTLTGEASCYQCLGISLAQSLELALLNRIVSGGGGGTPGGLDGSVQFNSAGAFGGFGNFNSGTSILTIPGDLLFNTDNADDIGAAGATRPRRGYFGTELLTPLLSVAAAANANAIAVTGYSLTGANAQSMISLAGTWNTSGTPTALLLNITNTASNAASLLMDLQVGSATKLSITPAGLIKFGVTSSSGGGLSFQNSANVYEASGYVWLKATNNLVAIYPSAVDRGMLMLGSSLDVGIARSSAGIAEINSGTFGTLRDIKARFLINGTTSTVAGLGAAGTVGRHAYVTDATAPAFGVAVVGGGAVVIPVFDDGTNWIVG